MASPLSRLLLLVTLIFALVGQGLGYSGIRASAGSLGQDKHARMGGCDMSHHQSALKQKSTSSHQAMMHHAKTMSDSDGHHEMAASSVSLQSESSDCCKTECYCPVTGCSSPVFISSALAAAVEAHHSELVKTHSFMHVSISPKSLYRPPIIA